MQTFIFKILRFSVFPVLFLYSTVTTVLPVNSTEVSKAALFSFPNPHDLLKTEEICPAISNVPVDLGLLKNYCSEYKVDYRLILAIIKQESQFEHLAVSSRGAIGLMQIMPVTGLEISEKLDIADISLPVGNLQAGIYYFSELYRLFRDADQGNRVRLALASYNAGPSRIYDAQEVAAYMGENPNTWTAVQKALPLLSKRYYSLHQSIWDGGRPRNGFFGGWRQTSTYVDRVMGTYSEYLRMAD